jgi:hypothetical protein
MDIGTQAPKEAALDVVDVWVTGIDAPREARLPLAGTCRDSSHATLPNRIRAALRDFHLTLDLPQVGEHDEIADALIDGSLLDGQPVRLVKLKPRT